MVSHEPHKIKTVRLISFPSFDERKNHLAEASFNVFNLTPSQITFDMCSRATNAVSQEQLSGQLIGDEAYAGSRNFEALQTAVHEVLGHTHVCPTHNELGCIKLVVSTMVPPGGLVPSNARSRIDVLAPRDVQVVDVRDQKQEIFTGNVDLAALKRILGEGKVALVSLQAYADGLYPFSLANLYEVRELADQHEVRLVLDGSRVIENAWTIQRHESGQSDRTIAEIVKEIAETSHVLELDGTQDPKSNTGGILTTDDPDDHEKFMNEVVVYEGLHTYGGMAGRTMEVLARGIAEMCDEATVGWIMGQVERFNGRLRDAGVPLEPGCDGAYIKADELLPHIEEHAQDTFSAALYLVSGVRAVATHRLEGDNLVPVQIPRLALMNEQLDQIADAIVSLYRQHDKVTPLEGVA